MSIPSWYNQPGLANPASRAAAITPDDGIDLDAATRSIWVGGAGDVAVITAGGDTVTIPGALAGTWIPVRATRVLATGTTATGLVALW
jgi:hypothetical protein